MVKLNHLNACGTFEEVNFAISKTIKKLIKENKKLPYLLEYYYEKYKLVNTDNDLTKQYNDANNLPKEFDRALRKAIFDDTRNN